MKSEIKEELNPERVKSEPLSSRICMSSMIQ